MSFVLANSLGARLAKELGLPEKAISSISIQCDACDVARVNVELLILPPQAEALMRVMREYRLVLAGETAEAA